MARRDRIDLRAFQQELSERLKHKTAAQVDNLRLALECADRHWLVRLGDTGEVLPLPEIVPVPLTRPWFLGISNVRGALYGVVDFGAFLTGSPTARSASVGNAGGPVAAGSRLVLLGTRFSDVRAGLFVNKVLGLRNLADFAPAPEVDSAAEIAAVDAGRWSARAWRDGNGTPWRELDLAALAADPRFLQIGA